MHVLECLKVNGASSSQIDTQRLFSSSIWVEVLAMDLWEPYFNSTVAYVPEAAGMRSSA